MAIMFEPLTSRFEMTRLLSIAAIGACMCAHPFACSRGTPQASGANQTPRLVIHNATVRSMTNRDEQAPQTVFIEGGRITRIVAAADSRISPTDRVIDATGQFLMPGLADMHSHAETPQELARYLAHGVTLLRIMAGFDIHLETRDAVAAGARIGPTLIVASPIIDGDPPARPELVPVRDAEQAKQRVRNYQRAGFDQIKLYHNLSSEAFFAAIKEARVLGLKAVGHVPIAVGAEDAFRAGYASSEHFAGMLQAIQREPLRLPERASSTEWSLRSAVGADPARVAPVAELARERGVWLVPTLEMHRVLQATPEQWDDWATDPRALQISPLARSVWQREAEGRQTIDVDLYRQSDAAWQTLLRAVRAAHEAGARLLVGTDYGMPHLYAGDAVHREIARFVDAGLSNVEALKAATAAPAEFLNASGEFGSVVVGARADLVLLGADPFEDVAALDEISSVVVRGHWFDREALDEIMQTGTLPGQPQLPPTTPCSRQATNGQSTIENFDDGDPFITGDGRNGMWFTFDDGSGGQQIPTSPDWSLTRGGPSDDGWMLHARGGGFSIWGSGVGVSFAWDTTADRACAYDATPWDGISFWAKGNVSGFAIGLPELDVVPVERGGRCEAGCDGSHQALVDLAECWQQYAFTFAEFEPASWSPEVGSVNAAELTGVQFLVSPNSSPDNRFEYWLDDIEFFRGDKPQGRIACDGAAGAGGSP